MTRNTGYEKDSRLREADKSAFAVFERQAKAYAEQDAPSDEDRAELHAAYIDYMALRAASRGRWAWRRGKRARFRRFVALRLATSALLFAPIWIAAVLIILDQL